MPNIVASDIVSFSHCKRRLWYDYNPPVDAEPNEPDPFDVLIQDLGLAHEQSVLERLGRGAELEEANSVEHTQDLMAVETPVIYQAQLRDQTNGLFGKPDFLILQDGCWFSHCRIHWQQHWRRGNGKCNKRSIHIWARDRDSRLYARGNYRPSAGSRMTTPLYLLACIATVLLTSISPAPAGPVVGRATIIDGDTIQIAGNRIRLHGIDAPESKQTCVAAGKKWACGQNSTFALSAIIERQWVHCRQKDKDRYGRIVAVCNLAGADGPNINAAMVRQGWALAYRRYSKDYVADEDTARKAKDGLWVGQFVAPWDWRRGKRLQAANDNVAGKCLIKGNIGNRGVRIYHLPGGAYYDRTRIDEQKGERWFCSEPEAREAGWRRSKR